MSLMLVVTIAVVQNCLKLNSCLLVYSSCIPATFLKNELLFYSTGTSCIVFCVLFLMSSDLIISLIPYFKLPYCLLLISIWGSLGFWLFPHFSHILSGLTCAILSAHIFILPCFWSVPCGPLIHSDSFLLRYPVQSEQSMSPWKSSSNPALLVVAYSSSFFQIVHTWYCRYFLAYCLILSHSTSCEILTSIHDVLPLGRDDPPLKCCFIFHTFRNMCVSCDGS